MEVISAAPACAYQRKLPNVCLTKSKVRKKSSQYRTPYDQTLPSPNTRSKLKLQDSASTNYQVCLLLIIAGEIYKQIGGQRCSSLRV